MWDVGDKNKTMFPMHGESQSCSSPCLLPSMSFPISSVSALTYSHLSSAFSRTTAFQDRSRYYDA